jgi:hypothetical protein
MMNEQLCLYLIVVVVPRPQDGFKLLSGDVA